MNKDITSKLHLNDRPALIIGADTYEINNSVDNVLDLVELTTKEGQTPASMKKAGAILFGDAANNKLLAGFSFADFETIVTEAIYLAMGKDADENDAKN